MREDEREGLRGRDVVGVGGGEKKQRYLVSVDSLQTTVLAFLISDPLSGCLKGPETLL